MKLNKMIDHTLLKPEATYEQIKKLCDEAREYDFMSVCVNSCWVKEAKKLLEGTDVKVCTVVGFPLGAMDEESKLFETKKALENGAKEIDMVINIGFLKDKKYDEVKAEIKSLADETHKHEAILKVILETCLLTDEEIELASKLSKEAGADFVKTSTGFSTAGAKVEHIKIMRETVGEKVGVKASGGIRDLKTALQMIEAGANRLGVSAGVSIIEEYNK